MRLIFVVFILACCLTMSCKSSTENIDAASAQIKNIKNTVTEYAVKKTDETLKEINWDSTKFPSVTDPNSGRWIVGNKTGWTSGFFPGTLWLIFEATNEEYWKTQARQWTWSLENMKYYKDDHDIGFRIMSSFGNGYRLTQNDNFKSVIITAAETLTSRFNPTIGCIKSWDHFGNFPVIIDNMMNLEILFLTSEMTGDKHYYNIAEEHALKTLKTHIRSDGSTYHVVDFRDDGKVNWKGTAQGYNDESTWARGQAWGIYGFTMAYRYTKEKLFLKTAIKLADYYIENLPESAIPYYDFEDPRIPDVPRDASAAAIAASSLIELSQYVEGTKYLKTSEAILTSLNQEPYLAKNEKEQSILRKSNIKKGEPEQGVIFADYYFLEAILRYEQLNSNGSIEFY